MSRDRGKLVLALHAHLPWVRHPGRTDYLEERWLFEAITETYLPLIDRLSALHADGVPVRMTLSVSPTLLGMLTDPLLQARYVRHLERLILFTDGEVGRLRHEPELQRVALAYRETFRAARRSFSDRHEGQLVAALRHLAERGVLELATSAATHAYLPLHATQPHVIAAQIRLGVDEFQRHFGWQPSGFWLPECGYTPAVEAPLAAAGIRWIILEGHGVALASPAPVLGLRAPVLTPHRLAAFGRDRSLARAAWSTEDGYPGDADYRDFDSDVAFELPIEAIRRVLPASGERVATGIKYHRITGPQKEKEAYDAVRARAKAGAHARNFVARCGDRLSSGEADERAGSLLTVYDAELLGHWWYEGLHWLEQVVRQVAYDQDRIELATPSDVLEAMPVLQEARPAESSWGEGGYHAPWLRGENHWLYRPLHDAAERMRNLCHRFPEARGTTLRALGQAARELLLAQASDWALMMSRGASTDYAVGRARGHLGDFDWIADRLEQGDVDIDRLSEIEGRDNLFPAVDYRELG